MGPQDHLYDHCCWISRFGAIKLDAEKRVRMRPEKCGDGEGAEAAGSGEKPEVLILAQVLSMQPGRSVAFHDGNDLLQLCSSTNQDACGGYLEGVAEVMASGYVVFNKRMCLPDRARLSQLQDVVVSYLVKHPEVRTAIASDLIANAYSEAFPCPLR